MKVEVTHLRDNKPESYPGFYDYRQNNSGGSFNMKGNLAINVYVEARDWEEANRRAQELGIYFNGCDTGDDCSCCGDRWNDKYRDKPDYRTIEDIKAYLNGPPSFSEQRKDRLEEIGEWCKPGDNIVVIYTLDGSVTKYIQE